MSVPVKTQPNFESGVPAVIFDLSLIWDLTVSSDGQQFLAEMMEKTPAQPITLVTNWQETVSR
jgi:hypothetical protein